MKIAAHLITILVLLSPRAGLAGDSAFFPIGGDVRAEWERQPWDKKLHAEVSAKLGFGAASWVSFSPLIGVDIPKEVARDPKSIRNRLVWTFCGCMVPGIGKEVVDEWDARVPSRMRVLSNVSRGAEVGDLIADAAGCAAGVTAGAAAGFGLGEFVVRPLVGAGRSGVQLSKEF